MVRHHTGCKEVRSVANDHAGQGAIVELRVGSDALMEAVLGPFSESVEVIGAILRCHVIERLEQIQVHGRRISSDVKVVPGIGSVALDDVVGGIQTSWLSQQSSQVTQDIIRAFGSASNREARLERQRVANIDCAQGSEDGRHVDTHSKDFVGSANDLYQARDTTSLNITVVRQRVESWAGPALVALVEVRGLELVFAGHVDGLVNCIQRRPLLVG